VVLTILCCSRMPTRTFHLFKIHCSVDSLRFLSIKPTKRTCNIHNSTVRYHSDMFRHCCVILPEELHYVVGQKYLILQKPHDQHKSTSRANNTLFPRTVRSVIYKKKPYHKHIVRQNIGIRYAYHCRHVGNLSLVGEAPTSHPLMHMCVHTYNICIRTVSL
jgi:hypothetical protein